MTTVSEPGAGPLHGVRVLVLTGLGPVPHAGMLLADLGADVVRVTRPPNRAARSLEATTALEEWDVTSRGTSTIELDLKSTEGNDTALRMADAADVFIEGYRPGVAERLGLGPEVLTSRNPRLVYARLTGYGQSGARSQDVGHDINYLAQSGALHSMARRDEAPLPPLNLLGDYAGGGMTAVLGIVSALYERERSGIGQVIDAAMVDGIALLTARIQGLRAAGGFSDDPGTNWIDSGCPAYATYRCADGRYLAVGALEDDFYVDFLSCLDTDTSQWPALSERSQWPSLHARIAAVIAGKTRDEWIMIFDGVDACVTPVLTFAEAATDRHNAERGVYRRVDGVMHPAPAPRLSRTPQRVPGSIRSERLDATALPDRWNRASLRARGGPS